MKKKMDIKIILLCILVPVFILVTNFIFFAVRGDSDNSTNKKEIVYNLAKESGYQKNYDSWFNENQIDDIILSLDDTSVLWIYKEDIAVSNWITLFDMSDNVGVSVFETWTMLNTEKTEDQFYSLINNSLLYLYDDYLLENPDYNKSYSEWCRELLNGDLVVKYNCTVSFDLNGGFGTVFNQSIKQGELVKEPDSPIKSGYVFIGWYYEDELWVFNNSKVNSSIKLVAKYEIATYKINYFNLEDSFNNSSNPNSYDINSDDIVLENPYKEHYNFTGWYEDELFTKKIDSIKISDAKNYNLYAGWEAIEYKVSYYIPQQLISTDVVFDVNSDQIDLVIDLDNSYEYELYLDISCETPYTNNVDTLLNYTNKGELIVYVDIVSRDLTSDIITIGNTEWTVVGVIGNSYTLTTKDALTYTTNSTINNAEVTADVLDIYSSLLKDLYSFDKFKLISFNNLENNLRYFDLSFANYAVANSSSALIFNYNTKVFQNKTVNSSGSSGEQGLVGNETYNIKPIISIVI